MNGKDRDTQRENEKGRQRQTDREREAVRKRQTDRQKISTYSERRKKKNKKLKREK